MHFSPYFCKRCLLFTGEGILLVYFSSFYPTLPFHFPHLLPSLVAFPCKWPQEPPAWDPGALHHRWPKVNLSNKHLDLNFPAPCPASSRRKLQYMLIMCGGWPKCFVSVLVWKGNEAASFSVSWHRSRLNHWGACFKGEVQSTNSLGFALPLGAELCLFPPFSRLTALCHTKESWMGEGEWLFLWISFRLRVTLGSIS